MFGRHAQTRPPASSREDAIETAWRIHGAIGDWTARVDAKASFGLALETAILGGITALSAKGRALDNLHEWRELAPYWAGVVILVGSALWCLRVVAPQLRGRKAKTEFKHDFIYFGHLRHWKSGDLEKALHERALLPVLSRQLVRMSEIAWAKHRRLQISLWGSVLGTALVALAGAAHHWHWR